MKIPLLILIYIENTFVKPRKTTTEFSQKTTNLVIKLQVDRA